MTIENLETFDHQVLDAVCRLAANSQTGVTPSEALSFLGEGKEDGDTALQNNFLLAVNRLRQQGLVMTNPSGHMRPTSNGQLRN